MHLRLVFSFLPLLFLGLTGCQTPLRYDQVAEGHWEAKALVRNKKESRSAVVALDVNAVKMQQLRMDVTAAMGHPVASLVMNHDQLTYVLIENKQYYRGPVSAESLKPVLAIPLNPRLLHNVFFDLPIEEKSWTCTKDSKGYLAECKDISTDLTIRWSERQVRRKLITIDHPMGTVQINVNSFQPKVEERAGLFELATPKSFRSLR